MRGRSGETGTRPPGQRAIWQRACGTRGRRGPAGRSRRVPLPPRRLPHWQTSLDMKERAPEAMASDGAKGPEGVGLTEVWPGREAAQCERARRHRARHGRGRPTGEHGELDRATPGDVRGLRWDSGHHGATLSGPNFILLPPTGSFHQSVNSGLCYRDRVSRCWTQQSPPGQPPPPPSAADQLPQRTERRLTQKRAANP